MHKFALTPLLFIFMLGLCATTNPPHIPQTPSIWSIYIYMQCMHSIVCYQQQKAAIGLRDSQSLINLTVFHSKAFIIFSNRSILSASQSSIHPTCSTNEQHVKPCLLRPRIFHGNIVYFLCLLFMWTATTTLS